VHKALVRCLLAFLFCVVASVVVSLAAAEIILASPLTTVVPLDTVVTGPRMVTVRIQVPNDAPADLGLGVVVRDPNGRWFHRIATGSLVAGPGVPYTIAGFVTQEVVLQDRGDRQSAERRGEMQYALRFRPPTAGHYTIRLSGTWGDDRTCSVELPTLVAEGPPSAPVVADRLESAFDLRSALARGPGDDAHATARNLGL